MVKNIDLFEIVALGTTSSILLFGFVIFLILRQNKKYLAQQKALQDIEHQKQQDILRAIIEAQEEERRRISSSLHDSVGADLSILKFNLSAYQYLHKNKPFDISSLNREMSHLDNTIDTIRSICRDLYPVTLQNYGFIVTFRELINKINDSGKIKCNCRIGLKENDLVSHMEYKLNLLRIMQEILNNILKYSQCNYLDIGFISENNAIKILLKHNGVSFNNHLAEEMIRIGKGLGLQSINNRIKLMKGSINYISLPGGSEIILQFEANEKN